MKVLVDTSIWIEFFWSRPQLSQESLGFLDLLIEDDRAVTIFPIQTEVLSGRISEKKEREIREAFGVMTHIDLDWNAAATWERLSELAQVAHKASLPIPGIVDRMILSAAEKAGASLWTLERALRKLAPEIGVRLF